MRVIVCGGRHYVNRARVDQVLDAWQPILAITEVVSGGARGADALAAAWAVSRGIKSTVIMAAWSEYGPSAGPIRNAKMLDLKPERVIAFPGGPGTANMVKLAALAGVPVMQFD